MHPVVDQIRKALERRDGLSEEVMLPLAGSYADAVTRVNERLYEAVALLQKGLRSEAIQRASMAPNAIQTAADLDFPEVEEWMEILQFLGIRVPPSVDREATGQLNEAIVDTQPLGELLRKHRRLAIAKAPLAWRLRVLRQIAKLDPGNALWQEDIESWEEVRLKQLPKELSKAIGENNEKRILKLRDELTSANWIVKPDPHLVNQASHTADQFAFAKQINELKRIGPQLHDAFGSFDESAARKLRTQWRTIEKQMPMAVPSDIKELAAPAFIWLDEMDAGNKIIQQRDAAFDTLGRTLNHHNDIAQVHTAYQQASLFDEPVPVELEQQYRTLVSELELRGRRKTQSIIASVIGVTLIAVLGLGFFIYRSTQKNRIASASQQMKELLDKDKFAEATQFVERLKTTQPGLLEHPSMVSLVSQLEQSTKDSQAQSEQFALYLQQASSDDPSSIDIDALNQAESLAVSEDEKAAVFEIRRARSKWEREQESAQTTAALKEIEDMRDELNTIESRRATQDNIQSLSILIERLDVLPAKYPKQANSAEAQAKVLRSRAIAMRDSMRKNMVRDQARDGKLNQILMATSLESHARQLTAFANEVPSSPMATPFVTAAKEAERWNLPSKANAWVDKLKVSLTDGVTPQEAKALLVAYQSLSEELIRHPMIPSETNMSATLKTLEKRGEVFRRIFDDLDAAVVAEIVTIKDDDRRYFVKHDHYESNKKRFSSSGLVGIKIVVDGSGAVKNQSFDGPLEVTDEPRASIQWLRKMQTSRRREFFRDWNGTFLSLAAELRKRTGLDAEIKEMILQHLLEGAASADPQLRQTLAESLEMLSERSEDRADWFKPKAINTKMSREVETSVIPRLASAFRSRKQPWSGYSDLATRKYVWAGCVLLDEKGKPIFHLKNSATGSTGELLVARPSESGSKKTELVPIGQLRDGVATLSSNSVDAVPGRPVFFFPSATPAS